MRQRAIWFGGLWWLAALCAVPVGAGESRPANPGSLWGSGNLIAEKGFNRHDLVTITIRESSKTGTKMDTTYDRKGSINLEIAKAFDIKTKGGLSYEPLTSSSKKIGRAHV